MTKKHEQSTHPRSHPTSFNLTCQPPCVRRKKPETLTPVTRTFPETVPITGLVSEKLTACAVTLVMESSSGGHRLTGPVTDHPIFFGGRLGIYDTSWGTMHSNHSSAEIFQKWWMVGKCSEKKNDCQPLTVAVKAHWEVHSHLEELPHPASFPWH